MQWVYLVSAILVEVIATLSLRVASQGRRRWFVAVAVGYVSAFVFLSLALREGLALGVAYGIWSAAGVAVIAIASKFLFKEPLTRLMIAGIALIAGGVLLVQVGSRH